MIVAASIRWPDHTASFNWIFQPRPDKFKTGVIAHVEFPAEQSTQTSPCNPAALKIEMKREYYSGSIANFLNTESARKNLHFLWLVLQLP